MHLVNAADHEHVQRGCGNSDSLSNTRGTTRAQIIPLASEWAQAICTGRTELKEWSVLPADGGEFTVKQPQRQRLRGTQVQTAHGMIFPPSRSLELGISCFNSTGESVGENYLKNNINLDQAVSYCCWLQPLFSMWPYYVPERGMTPPKSLSLGSPYLHHPSCLWHLGFPGRQCPLYTKTFGTQCRGPTPCYCFIPYCRDK